MSCLSPNIEPSSRASRTQSVSRPTRNQIGPASTPSIADLERIANEPTPELIVDHLWATSWSTPSATSRPKPLTLSHLRPPTDQLTVAQQPTKPQNVGPSMMAVGVAMFIGSASLWLIGLPVVLFSNWITLKPNSSPPWLFALCEDQHYKYLIPLQITFGLAFVIINWGGLKIFRHS